MVIHHYVPVDFGRALLIMDKTRYVTSSNNYRAITPVPIISKLFERALLCNKYLETDDTPFGFKKGLGCANAIFVLTLWYAALNLNQSQLRMFVVAWNCVFRRILKFKT
jgi:hypothetical protein